MQATSRAPAGMRDVFQLFELLDSLPGVFYENLMQALEPRHKAALAATCSTMRDAVQQCARSLTLRTGSCCLSRCHDVAAHLPQVRDLTVKPGNQHEALYVLPLFFMQAARGLTALTSLQLQDLLPDRAPEETQCSSCSAWVTTYDLSAVLATAAHCIPQLAALQFSTHYISAAECAAVSLMTGLTRLELRCTHGIQTGGLVHLSALSRLASLTLADRSAAERANHSDLAMMLGSSSLTHLQLGLHSLIQPLLGCLAEMHSDDWRAGFALGPQQPQQQQAAGRAAADGGATDALAMRVMAGAGAAGGPIANGAVERQQLPSPPALRSLSVVLSTSAQAGTPLQHICALTSLARLYLGWLPIPRDDPVSAMTSYLPLAAQQQLGSLTSLQELALGWIPVPTVLAALASNTHLTSLQLGGLFSALPEPMLGPGLKLPAVRRLTVQMETHRALLNGPPLDGRAPSDPLHHARCVDALAAFPGLTRLELAGRMYGPALAHLPDVLPCSQLRELLLPQRLAVGNEDLMQLTKLSGLTYLRLGWRSVYHAGPASYVPEPQQLGPPWALRLSLDALVGHNRQPEETAFLLAGPPAPAAADTSAAARGSDSHQQGASCAGEQQAAAEGVMQDAAGAASCSTTTAALSNTLGTVPSTCMSDKAGPCSPPLGQLRCLEVVGPLPPEQLQHLHHGLPSLRHLVLRDNPSWASGLPLDHLAALMSKLTRLELYRCGGVSAEVLERCGLTDPAARAAAAAVAAGGRQGAAVEAKPAAAAGAAAAGAPSAAGDASSRCYDGPCIVIAPRRGITSAELGRGYPFMGAVLLPCEEYGLMPDETLGPYSSEYLPPEPGIQHPQEWLLAAGLDALLPLGVVGNIHAMLNAQVPAWPLELEDMPGAPQPLPNLADPGMFPFAPFQAAQQILAGDFDDDDDGEVVFE